MLTNCKLFQKDGSPKEAVVFIVNVLFVTQISGHLTGKFFLPKDTGQLVRKVEKQVILKDLILP